MKPTVMPLVAWTTALMFPHQQVVVKPGTAICINLGGDFWRQDKIRFETESGEVFWTWNDWYYNSINQPYQEKAHG